jgi:hypothetical protein
MGRMQPSLPKPVHNQPLIARACARLLPRPCACADNFQRYHLPVFPSSVQIPEQYRETKNRLAMAHAVDVEQQTPERHHHHQRGHHGSSSTRTQAPAGSSSATCNPIRAAAAVLDPGQVCSNLGSLMPSFFSHCPSGPPLSPSPLPARVHQVWQGKNVSISHHFTLGRAASLICSEFKLQVFFLDGRVICGPNPRGLILTAMTVFLSEWYFLALVVDGSSTHPTLISGCSLILATTVSITSHDVTTQFLSNYYFHIW